MKRFLFPLLAAFACCLPAQAQEKPNIVFILADDLGYMDVGFNNPSTFYETPHLDRLATSGMVFSDFYAASPVCSPTRASLLTGKHPARLKTTNYFSGNRSATYEAAEYQDFLDTSEVTLAESLKDNGYATYFVGKWHLGNTGHSPKDQGFDVNVGGGPNGRPKSYFAPYNNIANMAEGPEGEYLPERMAEETIAILNQAAQQTAPFLLYLSLYSVHTPLQAPADLVRKYEQKAVEMELTDKEAISVGGERQVWPGNEDSRDVRVVQNHPVYAAMVEAMDDSIGRVLNRLDELNLRENTIVIFLSDNGGLSTAEGSPTSNRPLRAGKGWIYDGGLRTPTIVRWPGVTAPGTRCNVPALTTDFYPTLLEMVGLSPQPEQHMDGVSLVTLLKNPFAKFDRGPIFFHYPHYANQGGFPASAVRKGRYKLIQDLEDGAYELYDLETDLSEHNNLEQLEASVTEDLKAELDSWRRSVGANPLRAKKDQTPPKLW